MLLSKYIRGQKSNVIANKKMADELQSYIKPYPDATQEGLIISIQPSVLHL